MFFCRKASYSECGVNTLHREYPACLARQGHPAPLPDSPVDESAPLPHCSVKAKSRRKTAVSSAQTQLFEIDGAQMTNPLRAASVSTGQ